MQERSSVRLEHSSDTRGVGGSNPPVPMSCVSGVMQQGLYPCDPSSTLGSSMQARHHRLEA
jgi:hypothetical protein